MSVCHLGLADTKHKKICQRILIFLSNLTVTQRILIIDYLLIANSQIFFSYSQ